MPEIGHVLLAAYRGTVDDEGEDVPGAIGEVERTMDGDYGPFLPEASFVVTNGGRVVGASLVTMLESRPFIAHVVVHPDA